MHPFDTIAPHSRLDVWRLRRRAVHQPAPGGHQASFHWPHPHVSGWALVLLLLGAPAALQLPGISRATPADGLALAAVLLLVQLPVVAVGAVQLGLRRARHESVLSEVRDLETRVSQAESTVLRDEEKLHELRATISGIAMVHRLLRDRRNELPASTRTRLERLHESELERLQRLLADRHAQPAEPLEVAAIVGPYVESLRSRGHRVTWGETRARAWGRPDDVAEIVNTLLDNALRHAPGAEIIVSVRSGPAWVEVTVADRGPGVAPDVASHVFERGVRGRASSGQGIGLDRAHRLAAAMGGALRLSDGAGPGATFVLALPVSPVTTSDGELCLAHSG